MKNIYKCCFLLLLPVLLFAGCRTSVYSCGKFALEQFKKYHPFTEWDILDGGPINESTTIQFVDSEWAKDSSRTVVPIYIRIEYLGDSALDQNSEDSQLNEDSLISFQTGDISWKGFESYQNYGTLTLVGFNEKTSERWKVIGNQLDKEGTKRYSVVDVKRWLKTIHSSPSGNSYYSGTTSPLLIRTAEMVTYYRSPSALSEYSVYTYPGFSD